LGVCGVDFLLVDVRVLGKDILGFVRETPLEELVVLFLSMASAEQWLFWNAEEELVL
jgi:hypothetical protein